MNFMKKIVPNKSIVKYKLKTFDKIIIQREKKNGNIQ